MDADAARRKAAAERGALLDLAAILTHDLSNPLQSVTVLCELGMEEDDPLEAPRRAEQSLQAAERMRDLLHAYASVVRTVDRPTMVASALDRAVAMFARRLERHRISLQLGVERDFEGPSSTGLAVVSAFLAMIAAAEAHGGPFEARIVADGPLLDASLELTSGERVAWPDASVSSVDDILGAEGTAAVEEGVLRLRLETGRA